MFNQPKTATLPSPVDQRQTALEARQKQFELPDALFDKFAVPARYRQQLREEWAVELVRDPETMPRKPYRAIVNGVTSKLGGIWIEAAIRNGQAELWAAVGDPALDGKTDEDGEPGFIRVCANDIKEQTEEEREYWKKAWTAFDPVAPIKAEKVTMPNAKCPCGCGKKFKKHLGRIT